jgi:hypothetical protein
VEVEGAATLEVEGACWCWRWGLPEWRKKGRRIRERERGRERACIVREREGAAYAEWRVRAFVRDREGEGDISR